jgi:exosome complex component RRP42
MKFLGPGELNLSQIKKYISVKLPTFLRRADLTSSYQDGEKHARSMFTALESKLREEDIRRNQKAKNKFSAR